jgi:hypothetical protein
MRSRMKMSDDRQKSLVIVGNQKERPAGRTGSSVRHDIDACDTVVRFNEIKNRKRHWIGSKTDILFMRNEGATAHRITSSALDIPPALVPRQIVFSMGPEALSIIGDPCPDHGDPHRTTLFHDKLLAKPELKDVAYSFVETPLVIETYEILKRRSGGQPTIPSLGFLAIRYFMQSPMSENYQTKIVGFTFRGWSGHNWALEESITKDLCNSGRLSIL